MEEYVIATWTGHNGRVEEAQSDKGMRAIEEYAGLGTGSGKLVLSEKRITRQEFEDNIKRGVETV